MNGPLPRLLLIYIGSCLKYIWVLRNPRNGIVILLSHYNGLGPARAWRPRTGLFGKVFSPGLRRVKHGVVRNVKIRSMGNQSKFFIFITSHPTTFPEKTFIPAQIKPEKKTYIDFLSASISQIVDPSEAFYDEDGLCYQEKIIFLSHVIGSCEIITIEEED